MIGTRVRAQQDPTRRGTIVRTGLPPDDLNRPTVLVRWDGDPTCYPTVLGGVYVQGQDA